MFAVNQRDVTDLQDAINTVGQVVTYTANGISRTLRARVRYIGAAELANGIEQYAIETTFSARDFPTDAPAKGDSVTIDGARRGVMQVREVRGSGLLIAYKCGVQG